MASGKYKAQLVRGGVSKEIEIIVEEGGRSVVDLDELPLNSFHKNNIKNCYQSTLKNYSQTVKMYGGYVDLKKTCVCWWACVEKNAIKSKSE